LSFTVDHEPPLREWFDGIEDVMAEWRIGELPIRVTGKINILYGPEDGLIAAKTEEIEMTMYMRYEDGVTGIFKQHTRTIEMPIGSYDVSIFTNSKVTSFEPVTLDLKTVIDVSGSSGTSGEMTVSASKSFVEAIGDKEKIHVTYDDEPADFTVEEQADKLDISLQYTHSTHKITIDYNYAYVPEPWYYKHWYLFPMIVVVVALPLIYMKKRRKSPSYREREIIEEETRKSKLLEQLDEQFIQGKISEETYLELKKKLEEREQ